MFNMPGAAPTRRLFFGIDQSKDVIPQNIQTSPMPQYILLLPEVHPPPLSRWQKLESGSVLKRLVLLEVVVIAINVLGLAMIVYFVFML
jgi:hypothetical protein